MNVVFSTGFLLLDKCQLTYLNHTVKVFSQALSTFHVVKHLCGIIGLNVANQNVKSSKLIKTG